MLSEGRMAHVHAFGYLVMLRVIGEEEVSAQIRPVDAVWLQEPGFAGERSSSGRIKKTGKQMGDVRGWGRRCVTHNVP